MNRLRVGVIRGGPSSEYDVSLKTGGAVLQHLDTEKYSPTDILIDRNGVWHVRGVTASIPQALRGIDVAFNALHGAYGEDGTIQKILQAHCISYTGSGALASALAMNKFATKRHIRPHSDLWGLKLARHEVVVPSTIDNASLVKLFDTFAPAAVIKPMSGGSSVGVTIARSLTDFKEGIIRALTHGDKALVEEYIEGREATCGVVEDFRGQHIYALMPIEIIPPAEAGFFAAHVKYTGDTQEICPGNFTPDVKQKLEGFAREVHKALGLRHYSRSDFIVAPQGIYFLEVNTLPGLTPASLVPKSLQAAGCEFPQFLEHLIALAAAKSYA